mmetsp:Transcript_50562/g.152366  ORF Transcript_50562/g.152366 Transcript_50562/m.152366 type:complete len:454 (-) Transcript_50562:8-1369(-)
MSVTRGQPKSRDVRDLPLDHLARMIFVDIPLKSAAVDFDAVSRRLRTSEGRAEAKEWINIGDTRRLFFHYLLQQDFGQYSVAKCTLSLVREAYDAYPEAVRLPDSDGRYAAHIMCRGPEIGYPRRWTHENANVFRWLISAYPDAASEQDKDGRTPFHELASCRDETPALLNCVKYLLKSDPSVAPVQDAKHAFGNNNILPLEINSGDALDYACMGLFRMVREWIFRGNESKRSYASNSIQLSEMFCELDHNQVASLKIRLDLIIILLRALYDGRPFLPLHAAVQGCLCRPWHLVLIVEITKRYRQKAIARKADDGGNLPLHLFLESCMMEQQRALERGFCANVAEYEGALAKCFDMIFETNPCAAKKMNGKGRLPLHLAIESCPFLYSDVICPLLDAAPRSLLARDARFHLYPFAAAGVGPRAELDTIFLLLRRDPSVLNRHKNEHRKRKRVT